MAKAVIGTVQMFAVREIGKNVPTPGLTLFVDEAEEWLKLNTKHPDKHEVVCVHIKPLPVKIMNCGCCGSYHRADYWDDCRDDNERFADLEDAAERLGREVEEVFNIYDPALEALIDNN